MKPWQATCFLLLCACRTSPPPQPLPPSLPSPGSLGALTTPATEPEPTAAIDPTPPVELLLPKGVSVVEGIHLSATAAAFELYHEDLEHAGYAITTYGSALSMPLAEGERPLECMVVLRPANPDDPYEPKHEVVEVLVGPRGG